MAQGDVTVFNKFKERLGDAEIALGGGDLRCALLTSAATPLVTATDPRLSGGTPAYTQASGVGGYTTGGYLMNQVMSGANSWTCAVGTTGIATLDGDDCSWTQNGSSPTDVRWGFVYQNDANDYGICFVDLGSVFNMQSGNLTITWNGSGLFTLV